MANIFLNDRALARLRAAKSPDQSFSDWVLENAKPKVDWDKYLGCCKGIDVKKAIREIREERNR